MGNGIPIPYEAGMTIALAVVVAITVCVVLMLRRMVEMESKWETLHGGHINVSVLKSQENKDRISECADLAVRALANHHQTWTHQLIRERLNGIRILVSPKKTYISMGRSIAGEFLAGAWAVSIGLDLAAMCHEFAHALEYRIDGKFNLDHVGWAENGINAASDEYQRTCADTALKGNL